MGPSPRIGMVTLLTLTPLSRARLSVALYPLPPPRPTTVSEFSSVRIGTMRIANALVVILLAITASGSTFITPTFVSIKGGTVVYITTDEIIGCNGTCASPQILFGGIPSPTVTVLGPNQVSAITPPHANEAVVPVVIVTPTTRITIDGEFAFVVDREPVLIPLFFDSIAGFGGSRWSTELWVHNDTDSDVALGPSICRGFLGFFSCPAPEIVHANSARRLVPSRSDGAIGIFYSVPHDVADLVTFDLRLRDLAHPAAGATSVPVVRTFPMRQKIVFLNIPSDEGSRKLLRIYGSPELAVIVQAYDLDSGAPLAAETASLQLPTDSTGSGAWAASTSAIFDTPAVRSASRLRVEIQALGSPQSFWAMMSVTDNSTQHVTIIAPAQ